MTRIHELDGAGRAYDVETMTSPDREASMMAKKLGVNGSDLSITEAAHMLAAFFHMLDALDLEPIHAASLAYDIRRDDLVQLSQDQK